MEVAEGLEQAISAGMSNTQLAEMLHLDGPSMIAKFLGLNRLVADVRHLVDWGHKEKLISMTAATEIARLSRLEQPVLANQILEFNLGKEEVRQAIQLRLRSGNPIEDCVAKVVALRPVIDRRFVFVGATRDARALADLRQRTQVERDDLLRRAMHRRLPTLTTFAARLGLGKFTVVGGNDVAHALNQLSPDFETVINDWLEDELTNASTARS